MNCQETRPLVHGYVDGELDLTTTLAIEQHLEQCPTCSQEHSALLALRSAIQGGSLYFERPPGLHGRIQGAVRGVSQPPRARRRQFPWRWLAVAASLAFVALASWGVTRALTPRADDLLTRELIASHVRAQLLSSHRVDVESSDQHTVKPWFEGKVDFSPPVYTMKNADFELLGGRLDYLNNRSVAALVYQRRKHHISLYVWPSSEAESAPTASMRQTYHLVHWTQAGLTYWAISDLNEEELLEFAQVVRRFQEKSP